MAGSPQFAARMRIGEVAREVGVSTDTVRFYERSGWLPRATRRENAYRDYGPADVEHLRLIIDLRRLDLPLEDAARIAGWCHSGHCADATSELPELIEKRRAEIADRILGLQALDARLRGLVGHLERPRRSLAVVDGACCEAAGAVVGAAEGACACCAPGTSQVRRSQPR
jgi:DNA-binding transcriptional MerR regulator